MDSALKALDGKLKTPVRLKDQPHVRALLRSGANSKYAENHIESLKAKGIPGAEQALDFLDEILDSV